MFSPEKIVKTRIICIFGKPGSGKTFMAAMIASFYPRGRIYSNIEIFIGKTKINNTILDIPSLSRIAFSETKGVIVMDEGGVNVNARRSSSNANIEIGTELAMLGRKKHCDIIIIGQASRMVDVYFRELADYWFEMTSYFVGKDKLMFECKIINPQHGNIHCIKKIDLFEYKEQTGLDYNTLESSRVDRTATNDKIENGLDILPKV